MRIMVVFRRYFWHGCPLNMCRSPGQIHIAKYYQQHPMIDLGGPGILVTMMLQQKYHGEK